MDLALLERAIRRHRAKAAIVMTTCHNPLGSCHDRLPPSRSSSPWSRGLGVALIEDDVYGELAHDGSRPRPAKAFDENGLVLLCGSVSKTLAAGYRVGWLSPGRFAERVERLKFSMTSPPPPSPRSGRRRVPPERRLD